MNTRFAEIGKRLAHYIALKDISQSKLARMTATSASQIFNMLNGTKYGVDKLITLFEALPELNPEWLLFGHGEIEKNIKNATGLNSFDLKGTNSTELTTNNIDNIAGNNESKENLQEKLDICQAEKSGLQKIIALKDEMIEMLKSAK